MLGAQLKLPIVASHLLFQLCEVVCLLLLQLLRCLKLLGHVELMIVFFTLFNESAYALFFRLLPNV